MILIPCACGVLLTLCIQLAFIYEPVRTANCENKPYAPGMNAIKFTGCNTNLLPYWGDPVQDIRILCTFGCDGKFFPERMFTKNQLKHLYVTIPGLCEGLHNDKGWLSKTAWALACDHKQTLACVFDWSILSARTYLYVKKHVLPRAADRLYQFIAESGVSPHQFTLIGHSLGAHMAGLTGKKFVSPQLVSIIALDAAGVGYDNEPANNRLDAGDAFHTQCLHTNPNRMGTGKSFCKINFWPNQENGGYKPKPHQPGCSGFGFSNAFGLMNDMCSHGRSHFLFYSSITKDLVCEIRWSDSPHAYVEKETFGLKYTGKIGDFGCKTSDCYPFIINENVGAVSRKVNSGIVPPFVFFA